MPARPTDKRGIGRGVDPRPSTVECLLLFSPQFVPVAPPAGIAYLASRLRHLGLTFRCEDLNAQLYDYLLSRPLLDGLAVIGGLRAASLEGTASEETARLASRARDCASGIENAKAQFRRKETFLDARRFSEVLGVVEETLEVVSTLQNPGFLSLATGELGANSSSDDIIAAAQTEDDLIIRFLEARLRAYLAESHPTVVGISSADNIELGILTAALVRKIDPDATIVLGGPAATAMREVFVTHPEYFDVIDAMVVFDGELALPAIIEAVSDRRRDFSNVPNLIFRRGTNDEVVTTMPREFPLDEVLPPDYSGLDLELYLSPGPIIPVEIGRGCYWNGGEFCNRPVALTHPVAGARYKDVDQVTDELSFLADIHDSDHFYIVDDAVAPKVLSELAEKLVQSGLHINWMALSRFEEPLGDPDTMRMLRRSGCAKLGFGLESATPRVLQSMNKGITVGTAERVIKASHEAGVPLHIWSITGFPTETYDEAHQTMGFLEAMLPYLDKPGFSFQFTEFILEHFSTMNSCPERFSITDRQKSPKRFCSSYESIQQTGVETWPSSPEKVVEKFTQHIKSRVSTPELVTSQYIVGFILGMFFSTQGRESHVKKSWTANQASAESCQ